MKHSSLLIFTGIIALAACKPSVPSEFIQPDEMADVLYDYHLARAMSRNDAGPDVGIRQKEYFLSVLRKHDVTEAQFDSSLVYYYSRLDKFKDIYARVNERLANEAAFLGAATGDINRFSQYSAEGDTANIWSGRMDALLIPRATMNRFEFTVKADSTFLIGDSFMFQFASEFIWQNGSQNAIAYIVTTYQDKSSRQFYTNVSSTGTTQLRVLANDSVPIKDMRGFIYLSTDNSEDVRRLMFISQIQLIRFHNKALQTKLNNEAEEAKTDSLQSVGNTGGERVDTTRHNAGGELRSKHPPFRKGGGKH